MIRTRSICPKEASLVAVSALDELVFELVCASHMKLSPVFLDWIADEATPLVERQVAKAFHTPQFAASLRMGDHRLALARWVRQWVCPRIQVCFDELAACLPEFADKLPAVLQAAPARAHRQPASAGLGFASPA